MADIKVWLPAIRGGSGTDVFTRRLSNALRKRGIATEISWFSSHFQLAPFLLRAAPRPPGTTLVHANSWNAFAFKRPDLPLIATEQLGVVDARYRPHKSLAQHIYHETLIRRFVKASFRAASTATAVSSFTAAGLADSLGLKSIEVIYNWVDTAAFFPKESSEWQRTHPFRLLFVGNPTRRKGGDLLAPIMRALGSGFDLYYTSGLRDLSPREVAPNMHSLGQITSDQDLLEAYHRCDAFLFPSRFEGLPQAVLEAMACGKPVIAANASSLPEIVVDGVSGILCPTDSIDDFVSACRKLAGDPETRRQYGHAARNRVEELFSEDRVVPRYIGLYRMLLGA
jgi:alpha-maltose-1-phosphate synthase